VFKCAAAHVTDLGLLAEEVAPVSGEPLGNYPQAFSHTGLVDAAWAIDQAERRQRVAPQRRPPRSHVHPDVRPLAPARRVAPSGAAPGPCGLVPDPVGARRGDGELRAETYAVRVVRTVRTRPSSSRFASASRSPLRDVIPSLSNTLRRCHSTVRALMNSGRRSPGSSSRPGRAVRCAVPAA
jgi:hypothetical protein